MSTGHAVHGTPKHFTLVVAGGLILGLLAISGVVYSGSGPTTLGPDGWLLLAVSLAISVITMAAGITIIMARTRGR